jgi:hypothetical protein
MSHDVDVFHLLLQTSRKFSAAKHTLDSEAEYVRLRLEAEEGSQRRAVLQQFRSQLRQLKAALPKAPVEPKDDSGDGHVHFPALLRLGSGIVRRIPTPLKFKEGEDRPWKSQPRNSNSSDRPASSSDAGEDEAVLLGESFLSGADEEAERREEHHSEVERRDTPVERRDTPVERRDTPVERRDALEESNRNGPLSGLHLLDDAAEKIGASPLPGLDALQGRERYIDQEPEPQDEVVAATTPVTENNTRPVTPPWEETQELEEKERQRLAVDTMEADEEAVRMDLTREHTEGANDILARRDTLIAVNTTLSRFTNVEMENRLCLTLEEQIARRRWQTEVEQFLETVHRDSRARVIQRVYRGYRGRKRAREISLALAEVSCQVLLCRECPEAPAYPRSHSCSLS